MPRMSVPCPCETAPSSKWKPHLRPRGEQFECLVEESSQATHEVDVSVPIAGDDGGDRGGVGEGARRHDIPEERPSSSRRRGPQQRTDRSGKSYDRVLFIVLATNDALVLTRCTSADVSFVSVALRRVLTPLQLPPRLKNNLLIVSYTYQKEWESKRFTFLSTTWLGFVCFSPPPHPPTARLLLTWSALPCPAVPCPISTGAGALLRAALAAAWLGDGFRRDPAAASGVASGWKG